MNLYAIEDERAGLDERGRAQWMSRGMDSVLFSAGNPHPVAQSLPDSGRFLKRTISVSLRTGKPRCVALVGVRVLIT